MIAAPILGLLAASAAPPLPDRSVCLLAGPSASLVAVALSRRDDGFAVEPVPGRVWPFSTDAVRLAPQPRGNYLEGRDEGGGFVVSLFAAFAAEGGIEMHVTRGASALESLPLLAGSCAAEGSGPAGVYAGLAAAAEAGGRPTAETLRTGRLAASRDCQVVSAAGWVARFSVDYHEDGRGMTIRPADRNLWRAATVESSRLGLPSPSAASWIRFAFGLVDDSSPEMRGSINSIWVYATPDGTQSSARASFFGHDPVGPVETADVAGVCTNFVDEGAGA